MDPVEYNLFESLLLLVVGMTIVLASLLLLAGMISGLKTLDERINRFRIRRYSEKVETEKKEDEVNDELVAILAAAVMTTLRKPVLVRKVRFLGETQGGAWASTGRLSIMASHRIIKRKPHS